MRPLGVRPYKRCGSQWYLWSCVLILSVAVFCLTPLAGGGSSARAADPQPAAPCEQGKQLEKLGRLDAAEKAYLKDLETKQGVQCAPAELQRLGRREVLCQQGEALAAAGQKAKAEEAYVKVIEAEPSAKCASVGLKDVEAEPDLWEWVATAGKNIGSALAFLALAVVTALALIQVVVQILTRIPWIKDHRPARWLVRSGLEVKSMDDGWMSQKMGAQVASLMRGRITPHRSGGAHLVTGHAALSDTLKPLAEVSSEAKTAVSIASVLAATRRRQNFEIGGALQPKGKAGLGVSIELTREKSYLAFSTLWGKDFATPSPEVAGFQQLAIPAAGWIDHHIANAMGAGEDLLSKDPQSWALFKAGAAWQEQGDDAKAKALYDSALQIDPGNVGALANLGVIKMSSRKYAEAQELLDAALDRLTGGSS